VLVLNEMVLVIVLAASARSTIAAVAEHEDENRTISRPSRKRTVASCKFKKRKRANDLCHFGDVRVQSLAHT